VVGDPDLLVVSSAAAAPELLASERQRIGHAVEVASRGLVICASAREHGAAAPIMHVGLLARVILGRVVPSPIGTPDTSWLPVWSGSPSEVMSESVRVGRKLAALLGDVGAGLDQVASTRNRKGWARIPAVAAVRAATDLRSTLLADSRATAELVQNRS
jgi:hypothetical protein